MLTFSMASRAENAPRTVVAQEEIEGVMHNGYALYKKIPYAEAPVGQSTSKTGSGKVYMYYFDQDSEGSLSSQ